MTWIFNKETATAFLFLAAILAVIFQATFVFAETAGTFIFVRGNVWTVDSSGEKSKARKGDVISEGDTVITEAGAYAQLLMADDGYMAIRPNTKLRIDTFQYKDKPSDEKKSVFSLLKGGFRAITGIIGRENKENHKVKTPVATIGIRGTDHEPVFIPVSTKEVNMLVGKPGTYDKVNVGEAYIENDAGIVIIGKNEVGFTPDAFTVPERLGEMPAFYKESPAPQKEDATGRQADTEDPYSQTEEEEPDEASEPATEEAPSNPDAQEETSTTDDPTTSEESITFDTDMGDSGMDPLDTMPTEQTIDQAITSDDGSVNLTDSTTVEVSPYRIVGFATWDPRSPFPPHSLVEGMANDPQRMTLDGSGNLLGFESRLPVIGATDELVRLAMNSDYTLTDTGALPLDSGLGNIIWGRWHSSLSTPQNLATQLDSGTAVSPSFAPQDLHYLAGPEMTIPVVLPSTGTVSYTYVGGTTPTNHLGITGTLNGVHVTADFDNMTVDAGVDVTVGNVQLDAVANGIPILDASSGFTLNSDSPNFGAGVDEPTPLDVTCSGTGCGTSHDGSLAGGFIGEAGEGVAMGYSLNTTDHSAVDTSISGVSVFKK